MWHEKTRNNSPEQKRRKKNDKNHRFLRKYWFYFFFAKIHQLKSWRKQLQNRSLRFKMVNFVGYLLTINQINIGTFCRFSILPLSFFLHYKKMHQQSFIKLLNSLLWFFSPHFKWRDPRLMMESIISIILILYQIPVKIKNSLYTLIISGFF